MKAPGARMNSSIPSPWMNFRPNTEPLPSASRTAPSRVSDSVKPNPMPIPSSAESATLFFEANASARPRMMQLTTISGMNTPSVA